MAHMKLCQSHSRNQILSLVCGEITLSVHFIIERFHALQYCTLPSQWLACMPCTGRPNRLKCHFTSHDTGTFYFFKQHWFSKRRAANKYLRINVIRGGARGGLEGAIAPVGAC